ncbi:hypothetical protein HK101_007014, partial [Irineochytrium annulatum]
MVRTVPPYLGLATRCGPSVLLWTPAPRRHSTSLAAAAGKSAATRDTGDIPPLVSSSWLHSQLTRPNPHGPRIIPLDCSYHVPLRRRLRELAGKKPTFVDPELPVFGTEAHWKLRDEENGVIGVLKDVIESDEEVSRKDEGRDALKEYEERRIPGAKFLPWEECEDPLSSRANALPMKEDFEALM